MEQLEQQIAVLDEILAESSSRMVERYDSEVWYRQIESNTKAGKLSRLAERALHDHQAGRSTEL